VRWDDPQVAVAWPVREPLLSARDAALPSLDELVRRLQSD
jgi:dTDP-4-dehydrorhamnose 3,5-epimerase